MTHPAMVSDVRLAAYESRSVGSGRHQLRWEDARRILDQYVHALVHLVHPWSTGGRGFATLALARHSLRGEARRFVGELKENWMIALRTVFAALLASAALTACIGLDDDDEALSDTTSNLSSASWTGLGYVQNDLGAPPAMALLNGVEFYVYPWDDGSMVVPGVSHDLYWHRCDSTGACTTPHRIPDQESMDRVNLAAFNGYIYMVHQGDSDSTAVWFSRLDPSTGQWTPNVKLSFTTFGGSPALAAFNNKLYIVGSNRQQITMRGKHTYTTYPLWFASMGTDEQFSPTQWISSESASPPSLAVLGSKLYLAHRNGQTGEIVVHSMGTDGAWSAAQYIPAGPSNAYIQGDDVQLAAVNGYLHLVHHRFSGNETWWTYNRGCDAWAPEISVPSFSYSSRSSMATSIRGLAVNGLVDTGLWPYTHNNWYQTHFNAPPAPFSLPRCYVVFGG
jgi:hypothetical protein